MYNTVVIYMTVATSVRITVFQTPQFVKHEVVPVTKADQRWILPYLLPVLNSKKKTLKNCCYFLNLLTKTSNS